MNWRRHAPTAPTWYSRRGGRYRRGWTDRTDVVRENEVLPSSRNEDAVSNDLTVESSRFSGGRMSKLRRLSSADDAIEIVVETQYLIDPVSLDERDSRRIRET